MAKLSPEAYISKSTSLQKDPQTLLKNVFGYEAFKPLQKEVIQNILAKRDTLAIMPTGGGKSLCYQIPALIFTGLTVVVSPLISLMKDQVEQLTELGIPAIFLNSSLSYEEYQRNMERVRNNEIKLLYVAPETLLTPRLMGLLNNQAIDCLTIDEAHCISEWGHDFRPEYRQLVAVRERFPKAVCLALTATATSKVRQDIKNTLRFDHHNEFIASFNRPNLMIEVKPKTDPIRQALGFIQNFPDQSGIIYCFSRRQVDELAALLDQKGYSVLPYHAGLDDHQRKRNQKLFIDDDVQIVVATIAFGMGINKPNVRFIMHYDLPKSIESYYQEIGRAGRDGLPAHCLLLYSYADVQKIRYFIEQKDGTERASAYAHLTALIQFAESTLCRRTTLLSYFGENFSLKNCEMCDHCVETEQAQVDITTFAKKLLSGIKQTDEIFGATHIADFLSGADNQKIRKFGHQNLTGYGSGKELDKQQWVQLSQQLLQMGYLRKDEHYGSLKLTSTGSNFLKNGGTIWGTPQGEITPGKARRAIESDYDSVLFDLLRKKRKELAESSRVPPYVIFSDRTLMEIAAYYPMSPESLNKIYGVGTAKLAHYGNTILTLVRDYCRSQKLKEKPKGDFHGTHRVGKPKARHVVIGEAFNEGLSIQEIAAHFGVQEDTVLSNLERCLQSGLSLRRDDNILVLSSLSIHQKSDILNAFEKLGAEYLKPVFDEFGGKITYEELKLIRLHYLIQKAY